MYLALVILAIAAGGLASHLWFGSIIDEETKQSNSKN